MIIIDDLASIKTPSRDVFLPSQLYRSDSDSSTLPKKSPFIRNTLERRTLRYKQVGMTVLLCNTFYYLSFAVEVYLCVHVMWPQQSHRSSLAEQPTRTSLDLELDLQACRTRQRQLSEELATLRELKLRLEEPVQGSRGPADPPHWVLRDERFRNLLREAQRQVLAFLHVFKGIVHQKMFYCIIIYSPSCRSKPVWFSFLCWT